MLFREAHLCHDGAQRWAWAEKISPIFSNRVGAEEAEPLQLGVHSIFNQQMKLFVVRTMPICWTQVMKKAGALDRTFRKQDKGVAVGLPDEMFDPMRQRFFITCVPRIGHFADDKQLHLLIEIEWTP